MSVKSLKNSDCKLIFDGVDQNFIFVVRLFLLKLPAVTLKYDDPLFKIFNKI